MSFLLELEAIVSLLFSSRGCFWYLGPEDPIIFEDKVVDGADLFEAFFELQDKET